jgi:hypothetical protein
MQYFQKKEGIKIERRDAKLLQVFYKKKASPSTKIRLTNQQQPKVLSGQQR